MHVKAFQFVPEIGHSRDSFLMQFWHLQKKIRIFPELRIMNSDKHRTAVGLLEEIWESSWDIPGQICMKP